jgi:formate-dependent nitrite reductase cytochrome c552 subunit
LREAAIDSLKIIKARDAQGLFDVGDKIDKACESCHLEYWYPGDKKAVLEDQKKRVTFDKLEK